MQINSTAMSVSEFLDALANQARSTGLDINAETYAVRAQQAKQQEVALQLAEADLQDARDRLADIHRTSQVAA